MSNNPYQSPRTSPESTHVGKYRTAPAPITTMPPGIPYIVGNEAAERFSFYGMRTILAIFMTQQLVNAAGQSDVMTDPEAKEVQHLFMSLVYFFPLLGGLSDSVLGKYRTIISLSIVYCAGHAALALDQTRVGLYIGLGLIAIGSGGIKPCVSAHVGDQFGQSNQHLLTKVFSWFYFAINFGSTISTLLTPWLREYYGAEVAFGVPGILMLVATIVFWLGRNKYVHIPPGGTRFLRESFSREGLVAMGKLAIIYTFVAMFWALFDQTASAWVLQATHMDRTILGITLLPDQIQVANPVFVMLFIPLFSYVIYPRIGRWIKLTPLRKISAGLFIAVLSFAISVLIERWIAEGDQPHVAWQVLAYAVITVAEILVSITVLEFSYTQAPRTMKSLVMALNMLSISLGNIFVFVVNHVIQDAEGKSRVSEVAYYWFFTGMMAATAVLFVLVAIFYREKTYIQQEAA